MKSTSTAPSSIFSRNTYQTAITVAGEGYESYLEKDGSAAAEEEMEAGASPAVSRDSDIIIHRNKPARGSFALQAESNDDESHLELSSEEEEEEDEGIFFVRSKRTETLQSVFATSLSRDPYAAFLSQDFFKPSYIFPTTRHSIDSYHS
ncbi:hypothetical protein M407DRAFT_31816 [Tulasnella calospora MUT 4182]|uniref:Uncharacterized protein n=1 Tax=Tulasnella calospora MUT 4182 TaxID=1051891 RepID=A0A0C3LAN3_9AGAM|nr:hypothetical protein M407DRAFT_31816 [Tulasnella calospora MUT 4182]